VVEVKNVVFVLESELFLEEDQHGVEEQNHADCGEHLLHALGLHKVEEHPHELDHVDD